MIFIVLIFAFICIYSINLVPSTNSCSENGTRPFMVDYMSVEKTTAIKGIFIFIVFLTHFDDYITFSSAMDIAYNEKFQLIGQRMVTMFMFYSGFGVMESIKKKGNSYIKGIPVKRFFGTMFRFDIALVLFLILGLCIGTKFTLKQVLLSLIGWDSLGNSNWYIFAVLMLYLFTYIGFIIFKDKLHYIPSIVTVTLLTAAYVVILLGFNLKGSWWVDTVIIYPMGMIYSLIKKPIEKFVNSTDTIWLVLFICSIVATTVAYSLRDKSFLMREIAMVFFVIAVVLFTMRVSLNNKVLQFLGKHLFGIYILQRIPMILFKHIGLADYNIYLFFFASLAVTIVMAWLFEKYVGKLWNKISAFKLKKT